MGRYIGWTDLVGRYPDAAKIAAQENVSSYTIPGAEAEVDARLAARYSTPFGTPAPDMIRDLVVDLTYYKLTFRQKDSEKLYTYIMDRFASINSGTITLPSTLATVGVPVWTSNSYQSAFGPDDPTNWQPSIQSIEDAQSSRDD